MEGQEYNCFTVNRKGTNKHTCKGMNTFSYQNVMKGYNTSDVTC